MQHRFLALAAPLLATLVLAPTPARANGRFPAAGQVVVDPSDPTHLLVRATYGILDSRDHGAHWSWVCENAVGYGGFEDPMMTLTKDGSILAGIFEGLAISRDQGCQWDFAGGALDKRFVIDLATDRGAPDHVILAISNSVGGGKFLGQVWQSSDNGKSFAQAGIDLPASFLAITLDGAPSDAQRLYVSGRYGSPDYAGVVQRSKDRGQSWESLPIPTSNDQNLPYIGGVDPSNADLLYVRLDGDMTDRLVVSKDGGESWSDAITLQGNMLGFALSPDGATVAVGGDTAGIWTAPTATLQFTKVSAVAAKCLTWSSEGLYACASEFVDGFTVGVSKDAGKTFTSLMHLKDLCGPSETCGPSTSVGKSCPMLWGATQLALGGAECPPGADAGADGGTGGSAGTGGGSATSAGGSASSTGGTGCSCDVAGGAMGGLLPALSLGVVAALRARRRGRRRA